MNNNLIAQIPFVVAMILIIVRVIMGVRRGVIKELLAIPAAIVAGVIVLFLSFAFRSVFNEAAQVFLGSIVLSVLLLVLFKLIDTIVSGLKCFRPKKDEEGNVIPIKPVSRVFGGIVAFVVAILLIWGIFCAIMIMNQGPYSELIMASVRSNIVMKYIYIYNYLYHFASLFSSDLAASFAESMRQINQAYN